MMWFDLIASLFTDVSGRWTPPARGSWDRNPPTIGADHITAGPPYTAVDCRRPSFSCLRSPHLERPDAPRHVRIISACFPKPSEDASLPAFFPVTFIQCLRSDSCHYWHSNHSFSFLLYWCISHAVVWCCQEKDSAAEMLRESQVEVERMEKQLQVNDHTCSVYRTWFVSVMLCWLNWVSGV